MFKPNDPKPQSTFFQSDIFYVRLNIDKINNNLLDKYIAAKSKKLCRTI